MEEPNEKDGLVESSTSYKWNLSFLPIISMSMSIIAIILGYIVGISTGSVKPFPYLPFISDLGDLRPENSIFSFFITLSCYFSWCIFIIRYYQIKDLYERCPKSNVASLCLGACLILGKLMVSAFQLTNIKSVHFIGAGLYFVGVTFYIGFQVYVTYINAHRMRKTLLVTRTICLIVMSISIVIFAVFMTPGLSKYNRGGSNVAQTAEWLMAISKMVFISTFLADFWGLRVSFHVRFYEDEIRGSPVAVRYQSLTNE